MITLLRLALRNAQRNVTRSLLTALTVSLGTMVLTVALAWIGGVFGEVLGTAADGAGHARVVDPEFAERESMMPLYEHVTGVTARVEALRAVPGVVDVVPRIVTGVTVSVGDEIGDVFALLFGAPTAYFRDRMGLEKAVIEGTFFPGASPKEILIGATLAKRSGLKPGDEVVLFGQTQDGSISPIRGPVVGIVQTGTALVDQGAFVDLSRVQYLADTEDAATEILVFTADRDDAETLAVAVAAHPAAAGLTVQPWHTRDPWAGILAIIGVVRTVLTATVVFITALGVWNTMMMSVLERTSEIGVMRSMGLGRVETVFLFVVEATGIALLGGLFGVAVGGLGGWYLEVQGVTLGEKTVATFGSDIPLRTTLHGDMNADVAMTALGLALVMAFVGAALPSLRAALIQPVEAMRTRGR